MYVKAVQETVVTAVNIEMSEFEAQILLIVMSRVGGDPKIRAGLQALFSGLQNELDQTYEQAAAELGVLADGTIYFREDF
jgi:hypothetical protein